MICIEKDKENLVKTDVCEHPDGTFTKETEHQVLVVVDMQNDFINGSLGTDEAKAIVTKVANKIKDWDGPVVVTMDTHPENYLEITEGKYLPVEHCIENTDGWKLHTEIAATLEDKDAYVLQKPTFGSFKLAIGINDEWGETPNIEMCGVCTDICVVANALILKTAFPDAKVTVDSSCCAATSPENHEAALKVMAACQVEIK